MTFPLPFAFLLKSYSQDFELAKRMVASFNKFNHEGIHLFVVVSESDMSLFSEFESEQISLISEFRFSEHLVDTEVHDLRPGYINQEIIKLAFWELNLAQNYFCVDSDAEFIRPFSVNDFMFDAQTPYSVLVQDLELAVEPQYYSQYWRNREVEIGCIAQLMEMDTRVVLTCHGHTVFSAQVLQSFVTDFLSPRQWDYRDALAYSPYEFSWYNLWLQKTHPEKIHPREPWIKVFHHEGQYLDYLAHQVTVEDLARGYLGVVINSSFARELPNTPQAGAGSDNGGSRTSKGASLAQHLSYGELGTLIAAKIKRTARNKFHH